MQPYWFPYIGYYKLIEAVDIFVFLTDAQYIRRGWINRNLIKSPNKNDSIYFTIPVKKTNRNSKINEIEINGNHWIKTHLKTFICSYGGGIIGTDIFKIYQQSANYTFLCDLNCDTLIKISKKFGFLTKFLKSENILSLDNSNRIIDICHQLNCDEYINLPGGKNIYSKEDFSKKGIKLKFLNTDKCPKISILDLCFSNENINDVL